RLAYVPGDVTLWPGLTGGEIIDLLGRLRGPRTGIDPRRRQELTERFDFDPAKKARAYSKGNRQKVALIAALASDAELLILDEPTSGLDPLMEAAFRECVNDERHDGRTILLSSHILAEAEALADRVTIIREGRAVETGTLAEMRHLTRESVDAELARPADRGGRPLAHLPSAHARGTVPASLFDRTGDGRSPGMTISRAAWTPRAGGALAGTGELTRLAVRRDRIALPAAVYVIVALVAGTAYSFRKLYPTQAGRAALAATGESNPA